MKRKMSFTKVNISTSTTKFTYDAEKFCPICKAAISPVYIASSLDSSDAASVYSYCEACNNSFISKFSYASFSNSYGLDKLLYSEPNKFQEETFDDHILELSPQFIKIYNQALAAETSNLDEIAGIGYRKSLEFLIKDFAIHENPKDDEEIKKMLLSQCIGKYVDDTRIKVLATKSAWIGNDEAHYVKKQEDRDIHDMKAFIKAAVYFISMVLITEDATTIDPLK